MFLASLVKIKTNRFYACKLTQVPTRRFCKVKEEAGISESIALLSRTSYAKKRMGISIMDSEDVKKHENTSNLPELHFRGYDYCLDRCKFGDTVCSKCHFCFSLFRINLFIILAFLQPKTNRKLLG